MVQFRWPTFSGGHQKLSETPRMLKFFLKDCDGLTLKVRQSQDPLNKLYLKHFEKLSRGGEFQPHNGKV
jgi:hypothetical protein